MFQKSFMSIIFVGIILISVGILVPVVESSPNAATTQFAWQSDQTPTPQHTDGHDSADHDDDHMDDMDHEEEEVFTPEMAEEGKLLFTQKGCIACHGENAQGTDLAPNLAGHAPAAVRRQVRMPTSNMPVFLPTVLSNEDVTNLVAFIVSLETDDEGGEHAHQHMSTTIPALMIEYHVLSYEAMLDEDYDAAMHNIEHILEITTPPHQTMMELVLEQIENEDYDLALETLEGMIEGVEVEELHDSNAHLQMALSWIISRNQAKAIDHLTHAMEDLHDDEHALEEVQHIIEAVEAEDWPAAEEELIHLVPPMEMMEDNMDTHDDMDMHDDDMDTHDDMDMENEDEHTSDESHSAGH